MDETAAVTPRVVRIERIEKTMVFLTAALALLCLVSRTGDAISLAVGGAVSFANLRLIRMLVSRLMTPAAAGRGMARLVTIKFLLLLTVLAVALQRLPIDMASFLVGAGLLFAAIVLEAVLLGERAPDEDPESGERRS